MCGSAGTAREPSGVRSVLAVLVVVTVLNNVAAPAAYLLTSVVGVAVLLLLADRDGLSRSDLGLGRESLREGRRWALALVALALAGYLVVLAVPALRRALVDVRGSELSPAGVVWQTAVRVPFGTVLLEEVAFRGVLWGMITRRRGPEWATATSSALFGLWHVLPSLRLAEVNAAVAALVGSGPLGRTLTVAAAVAPTAAAGVVFCELRRRSGGLLAPVALHWALNAGGYLFAWAAAR
jgi:uncharacterized protein